MSPIICYVLSPHNTMHTMTRMDIPPCRCLDLPPEVRTKKRMAAPLLVISGPNEPKNMEPYMSGPLQELAAYGPTGDHVVEAPCSANYFSNSFNLSNDLSPAAGPVDLKVCEVRKDPSTGHLTTSSIIHQPILAGVAADSPAAVKLSKHFAPGAFLGCGNCLLQGVNTAADTAGADGGQQGREKKGVMHYLGYAEPTTCGLMVPGAPNVERLCGDPETHIDHASQVRHLSPVLYSFTH